MTVLTTDLKWAMEKATVKGKIMADSKSTSSGGISFLGLLQVVLITLKLIGKLDWSWFWVWSPFWMPVTIVAAIFVACGLGVIAITGIETIVKRRRKRKRNQAPKQVRNSYNASTYDNVIDIEARSVDTETGRKRKLPKLLSRQK